MRRSLETVGASLALTFTAVVAAAWILGRSPGLGPLFAWKVSGLFAAAAVVIGAGAARHRVGRAFGWANRVTVVRAALTAVVVALIGERGGDTAAWIAVGAGSLALALDGLDGWLARRQGLASDFGARFDMETDALLILGAAVLAWQYGKAGAWVLAAGLMRYVFVVSGRRVPWMSRALPPSVRRKAICVLGSLSLIVCLLPVLQAQVSHLVALAGVTLLGASFAIDVAWLARNRSPAADAAA